MLYVILPTRPWAALSNQTMMYIYTKKDEDYKWSPVSSGQGVLSNEFASNFKKCFGFQSFGVWNCSRRNMDHGPISVSVAME